MKHKPVRKRYHHVRWDKLPLVALVEILKSLSDQDRISCAQVCRQWNNAFEAPLLWRKRQFEFGGFRFSPLGQAAISYAKKFGSYLRETKIVCHQLTSRTCQTMVWNLEAFLQQLTCMERPPCLTKVEFTGLELEFWRFSELRDQVAECLFQFFLTQQTLKSFQMTNAQFPLQAGVEILQAMSIGNSQRLETLLIDHFFRPRIAVYQSDYFNTIIETFTNLQTIELDYCCLSDRLVSTWIKSLQGKLKRLRIQCCDNEPYSHLIKPSTWKGLGNACPDLEVVLSMFGIGLSSEVIPILAHNMPLSDLTLFAGYDSGVELGLSESLTHIICSFHKRLASLDLEFDNYHDRIDDEVITLVSRCQKLHHLKIKARINIEVARFLCRMVQERRTALTFIDLILCDISPLETEQLRDLRDEVENVQLDTGVNLTLRDDIYYT